MTDNVSVIYESGGKKIEFSKNTSFWLSDISGLGLDIAYEKTQNYFSAGENIDSQNVQGRQMSFTGDITGDIKLNRELMLSAIVPYQSGTLTFEEDGQSWQIEVFPQKTPEIEPGAGMQVFQFTLFAQRPYFHTKTQKTYTLSGFLPKWQTPFFMGETFYISQQNPDAFTKINNIGNIAQSFVLSIYASATVVNPGIKNIATGELISIEKTMQKGEKFIISTHDEHKRNGEALLFFNAQGASENAFRFISPESDLNMQIMPGENTFAAFAQENKHNLQCSLITWGGERHSL